MDKMEAGTVIGTGALKGKVSGNENVVGFTNVSVGSKVNAFLSTYESKNTRGAYSKRFTQMFMYMYGKDVSKVTQDELKGVDITRVKAYRDMLKRKYKSNTVNQNIFACKALWDSFKEDGLVTTNPFDIKKIKVRKEVHYGSLSDSELEGLLNYCSSLDKKGMTKSLYFEFLATVTCRKGVAQRLTFSNIKQKFNRKTNSNYWVVDAFDKTDEVDRAITDEFYERLLKNYESYSSADRAKGVVFNVENQTLEKTLNNYCVIAGIDKAGRMICQHSIKSSGLDLIQDVFGDINMTAKAGGHRNIQTTYNNYVGKNVDYSQQPSILLKKDFTVKMLEGLSREELLRVLGTCDKGVLIKVCLEAERVGMIEDAEIQK